MEFIELLLMLLAAVLLSSVLEPLLPRVSLPLVQVLIGIVISLSSLPIDINISSDLFLVIFIAPLLFDESRNANSRGLWVNRNSILSLAIGLVLALVLVVGFAVHALVPSIPLAAAFALGAALGPTDAVAVAALGKDIHLSSRQRAQLTGEGLLNDASGVVSFHFAILAAVTGTFSFAEASKTFAVDFLGGIGLGLFIGIAVLWGVTSIRRMGLDNVTFHVVYEICLPFFIYLVAETVHVSGILAVVAAGIIMAFFPQRLFKERAYSLSKFATKVDLASETVWSVLSFILNGLIFVGLGVLLPETLAPTIAGESILDVAQLIGLALFVTAVVIGVRFVWVSIMDALDIDPSTGKRVGIHAKTLKDSFVTTLAGPKGAVSLSIALAIPVYVSSGDPFPERDLLLFVVCAVIILTLLIANYIVPLLASKPHETDAKKASIDVEVEILDNVISQLLASMRPGEEKQTRTVVASYRRRSASLRRNVASDSTMNELNLEVLKRQDQFIRGEIANDNIDKRVGERYLKRLNRMKRVVKRNIKSSSSAQNTPLASQTNVIHRISREVGARQHGERGSIAFKIGLQQVAVRYLEGMSRSKDEKVALAAKALLDEHKPVLSALKARLRSLDESEGILLNENADSTGTVVVRKSDGGLKKKSSNSKKSLTIADVQAEALRLELEQIQQMLDTGRIGRRAARELRNDVYLLQMGLDDS